MPRRGVLKSAVINFNSSGDNTVIAAVAAGPINVYGIQFTVAGATNITYKDSVAGNLSGAEVLTANGSAVTLQIAEAPYFAIQAGSAFVMNSSQAVQVSGQVWYLAGG